jgi:CPA2 family monovalent cation:H+ antiporter-2
MLADLSFYGEFALVTAAALIGLVVARWARQPVILGYIVGGILISPFTYGPSIHDIHHFDELAEIGIILLMFSVGAEFSIRDLARVKWLALLGTPLAVVLITGITVLFAPLFGWSILTAIVMGVCLSVTSTMVMARILMDRGQLKSDAGRVTIGLSLVEDMLVVIFVALLPVLAVLTPDAVSGVAWSIGRAVLLLGPVLLLSWAFVPWLLRKIHESASDEFLLLSTLALCLIAAAVTELLGLSLALGAFCAGLLISGSSAGHRAIEKISGLRDLCVAVFFVSVGALIDPQEILRNPVLIVTLTLIIVLGKFIVWYGVARLFRFRGGASLRVAVLLTQIGEFSFIIASVARVSDLIGPAEYSAVLASSLLSILINSQLTKKFLGSTPVSDPDTTKDG